MKTLFLSLLLFSSSALAAEHTFQSLKREPAAIDCKISKGAINFGAGRDYAPDVALNDAKVESCGKILAGGREFIVVTYKNSVTSTKSKLTARVYDVLLAKDLKNVRSQVIDEANAQEKFSAEWGVSDVDGTAMIRFVKKSGSEIRSDELVKFRESDGEAHFVTLLD